MTEIVHLLIIDDDTGIRTLLSQFLQDKGYFITEAKDTFVANEKLQKYKFDLLIVDVMMPGETGIEFTKKLRKSKKTPILMLTAMNDIEDRISGLSSGADDYLAKPFEPRELLLRIQNILNRSKKEQEPKKIYRIGNYIFNKNTQNLTNNSLPIILTSSENLLLKALCDNIGKIVSREELAALSSGINERSIDVQITRLRNKIEENPKQPAYLKTVRGKGYILYGIEE